MSGYVGNKAVTFPLQVSRSTNNCISLEERVNSYPEEEEHVRPRANGVQITILRAGSL